MGQPKIWDDSGLASGTTNDVADGDLKVVATDTPYKLQLRQGGAWVDFLSQSVIAAHRSVKILKTNVVADAGEDTLVTIADFDLPMLSINPVVVYFKAVILYTAAAATTGSRWTVDGPSGTLWAYRSSYPLSATTETVNHCVLGKQPTSANASSRSTTSNLAIIEGFAMTPGEDGTLRVFVASGVVGSAITAKAGSRMVYEEYRAADF